MASLFVSHSSADGAITAQLVRWLRAEGFGALFADFDPELGIPSGRDWELEIYAQLRKADAVIFVASAVSVESRWCFAEISLARSTGKPVLPLRIAGTERLSLLHDVQWIDLDTLNEETLRRLRSALRRLGLDPRDSFDWNSARAPYPGLAAFSSDDAAVFFGRRKEVAELRDRLQPSLQRGRGQFVAIVGPSGSGKSSLVAAGLMPQLARLRDRWVVVPGFAPGGRPIDELARSLARAFAQQGEGVDEAELSPRLVQEGSSALVSIARRLGSRGDGISGSGVVLFMDQAEELVTRTAPDEGARFLRLLRGALHADSPLWVVATLRSDFFSVILSQVGGADIFDETYAVGPLGRERLPEVVEGPARRVGLDFEAGLVQRMVDETLGGDSLPLLAFTLRQLYDSAEPGRAISVADYERVGGVVGALRRQADVVLSELTKKHSRAAVLDTLLQLVSIQQGGDLVRRPVQLETLEADEIEMVQAFVGARLLRINEVNGDAVVEVAHEALLRLWEPLQKSIDTSRRTLEVRSEIERTARDWDEAEREESFLPRGVSLSAATADWTEDDLQEIAAPGQDFLIASKAYASREVRATQRSNRRLRNLAVGLVALLLVVGMVSVVALQQGRAAERQRVAAESQKRIAEDQRRISTGRGLVAEANALRETDPDTSLKLGIAALNVDATTNAEASLLTTLSHTHYAGTLTGHTGIVNSVAFSPDRRTLATASDDNTVRLWDVGDGALPAHVGTVPGGTDGVAAVAFSSDRRTLAVANAETVILWNVADRTNPVRLAPLPGRNESVYRMTFSPDGKTLGTSGDSIRLWDITRPTRPKRLTTVISDGLGGPVEFSHDGRLLAVGDFAIRLWDVSNPRRPNKLSNLFTPESTDIPQNGDDNIFPSAVSFSGDDRTLAIANGDETLSLWDISTPTRPRRRSTFLGHTGTVSEALLTRDGRTLAITSDNLVILWDVSERLPKQVASLGGHQGSVNAMALSPDGSTLATGSDDNTAILWGVSEPSRPAQLSVLSGRPEFAVDAAVFGPDTNTLATTSVTDQAVLLWDLADRTRPKKLGGVAGHGNDGYRAELSPDIRLLATGGGGRPTTLWDVTDRKSPTRLARLGDHTEEWYEAAFSSDGHMLAVYDGESVTVWNLTDELQPQRQARLAEYGGKEYEVVFPPDGRTLAISDGDKPVVMWDVTDSADPPRLTSLPGTIGVIAFSPNNQILATYSKKDSTILWNVTDRSHPAQLPTLDGTSDIRHVSFSPDGHTLATASGENGPLILWDVTDPTDITRLAVVSGAPGVNSVAFSPDGRTLVTGGNQAILWDVTDVAHPIQLAELPLYVDSFVFSPDGRTLLSLEEDGRVTLWDMSQRVDLISRAAKRACEITGRGLSAEEWAQYAPGLPHRRTCN